MRKQNIFTRTTISMLVASALTAASAPAFAADDAQIEQMQNEIKMLEQKLEAMKNDVAKTKADVQKTEEAQQETQAKVEKVASSVPNPSTQIRGIPSGKGINYGKVNVQFGGFAASETAYRSKSLQSDIGSPFKAVPFGAVNPAYNQTEFRGTERQSRVSMLATGAVDPDTIVSAYYELDFLSSGTTANPNESNSFSPRTRHAYANIDWLNSGFHLLAGQTWSLATLNTHGITPRNEYIPLTVDAQYNIGFTWQRQWQLRMVQDWDQKYWAALSFENSQTVGVGGAAPAGTFNQFGLVPPGGSLFNPVGGPNAAGTITPAAMSMNKYPDVIAKFAAETDFGHFEIFDVMRNFQSNYGTGTAAAPTAAYQQSTWTNGIGFGAIIPIVDKTLEFSLSGLSGKGMGRYGTTQLVDATYNADGSINPVKSTQLLAGFLWHADPKWDIYGNYGIEKVSSTTFTSGATTYGFGDGVTGTSNLACSTPNYGNNQWGAVAGCSAGGYIKDASEGTLGFWWSFYKGDFGRAAFSVQYSHVKLDSFAAALGGSMSTTDNMLFTSLRYFPF